MISLIACLGNHGKEYEKTRHNAAWVIADKLQLFRAISWQHKFHGQYGRIPQSYTEGKIVHVVKPETYMNLSGDCVGAAASFFKIPAHDVLVIHDELELFPATLSLKWSGGLGGHNGLRSIKAALGTADFWRIRIGIGRPQETGKESHPNIAQYVLSPFASCELAALDNIVPACDKLLSLLLTENQDYQALLPLWKKVAPEKGL